MRQGKVYLIGAGPGDVELLTLQAVRALGEADVILLDALANRDVLRFVRRTVRVIEVGKRGGCKSTSQTFIERLMVRLARGGKTVARVKGGDPFVFGRGGEEMWALRAAGIEVVAVTGITAGIGVPAALGIPVTHREFCHGVTLVTGHTRGHGEPDWEALGKSGTTLVIYMGMTNLASICARLIAAGLPGETPAVAIQNGTLSAQRSVMATLVELPAEVARADLGSPAIVIVGEVVRFANAQQSVQTLANVA
jgi:uroporphyrin-III C-methyltransferase